MTPDNENLTQSDAFKLQALEELQNSDFAHVKESLQLIMTCAMPHEYLDNGHTRTEIYADFKAMYNFLLKMEMSIDPEMEYVNLLTD